MCSVCEIGAAVAIVRVVALEAKVGMVMRSSMVLLLLLLTLLGRGGYGPKSRLHGGEHDVVYTSNSELVAMGCWLKDAIFLIDVDKLCEMRWCELVCQGTL